MNRPLCDALEQRRLSSFSSSQPPYFQPSFNIHKRQRLSRKGAMRATSDSNPLQGDASAFIRPHLRELAPYTPIEPFEILSARLGRSPDQIIKLDANENPYGPPQEVREALGNMPYPNIYPDPETRQLRAALSAEEGIPAENLLVGCGADELIDLLMRCCLDPGDFIVDCPPTFTMYTFDAAVNDARVISVPRKEGFQIDVTGVKEAVLKHGAKMVFLTSPNNPDGSLLSEIDLLSILQLPVLVVLDEAYIEFASVSSKIRWVLEFHNLVVLRTFSKSAGLAGIRVGYGGFPSGLIDYMWRAKQPYNVSVAAETAACAALSNKAYLQEVCEALKSERQNLYSQLQEISYLEPYPSESNFILCNVLERDASALKDTLAKKYGIMVRHYTKKGLSHFIRISAGKPEHTENLIRALKEIETENLGTQNNSDLPLATQVESETQPAGSFA